MSNPIKKFVRVAMFIDVQNIYYSAKFLHNNAKVDFKKLLYTALDERQFVRAIAYTISNHKDTSGRKIINIPKMQEQKKCHAPNGLKLHAQISLTGDDNRYRWYQIVQYDNATGEAEVIPFANTDGFISLLKEIGYEIKSKPLIERGDGSAKGNWDLQMAVDMISHADKCDAVILVSGDGDFAPVVRYLQHKGLRVEVYSFKNSIAMELKETADDFYEMGESFLMQSKDPEPEQ